MRLQKNTELIFPLLLVAYEVAIYLSNDMYLPALPNLAIDYDATPRLVQWTLTSWFLGASALQLFIGPLADRYGRRSVLLLGGLFFIISTCICAVAHSLGLFIVARFIQGSAVCTAVVAGYATIHELFDYKQAVKLLALMGSITVLAPALGPLFGSGILLWYNWQMIFWILAVFACVVLSLLYFYMPETLPPEKQHTIEYKNQLAIYFAILTNKPFMLNTLTFCLLFTGMIAWIAIGPFLVINDFKQTATVFGIYQAIIFGCFIIGSHSTRYLTDQTPVMTIIKRGLMLVWLGGVAAMMGALLLPHSLLSLVLSLAIFAGGSGLCFAPLNRRAMESCAQPMGSIVAMFSSLMSLAGVLATLIIGVLYDHQVFSLALLLLGLSLLVFLSMMQLRHMP